MPPPPLPRHLACEAVVPQIKSGYESYVNGKEFIDYIHRLHRTPPLWRPLRWLGHFLLPIHLRNTALQHLPTARPLLGLVLMRNTSLRDPTCAAPALILATERFNPDGFDELHETAERLEALGRSPDPTISDAIEAIYLDDEYRAFRRRALPACVGAPGHIRLHDELMRGDDLFDLPAEYAGVPHPFVVLLATPSEPYWSAVVPGRLAISVRDALLRDHYSTPPPLPPTSGS